MRGPIFWHRVEDPQDASFETFFFLLIQNVSTANKSIEGKHCEITKTRWWFQIFFIFTPIPAKVIQFDEHIFQMGGSTTNCQPN